MWKSWKFIVPVALVAVMLIAGTAGAVLAGDDKNGRHCESPLAEVAEILGIEQEDLQAAFKQVRGEMLAKYRDGGQREALLAEVAEIIGVEPQELQDAFDQVRQSCDEIQGENRGGRHHKASLAEVAEILGVEQEDLQAAFDQVRGEMLAKYRDGEQHETLLAEVAEILGVELQELQDAFDQVRQSCDETWSENRDGKRPFKHPFGRGHDGSRCDDHATE